jgi:tRNA(fMet)-specific endonuclease VapC
VILIDTDVASFLIKGDDRAKELFAFVHGQQPALAFMSAAELFQWAELRYWGERRKASLEVLLTSRYVVLDFELGLAKEWARVRTEGKTQGRPISVQDGWVAASARYYDLPLLTYNHKDFAAVAGLRLVGDTSS